YTTAITLNLQTGKTTGTSGFANIGSVIGGSATTDTVVGPDTKNNWQLTDSGSGMLNGTFGYSGIERLTGGALDDQFVIGLNGGLDPVTGKIDGKGGTNTLVGREAPTLWTISSPNSGTVDPGTSRALAFA